MGEVMELRIYDPGRTLRVLLGHATRGQAGGQHGWARMVDVDAIQARVLSVYIREDP
jgi:hypothetical protein